MASSLFHQAQKTNQGVMCADLNLLVERSLWPSYLLGMKRAHLVACIVELMGELELMLWVVKGALTGSSQASVIERALGCQ
jgi:hypothetical protein